MSYRIIFFPLFERSAVRDSGDLVEASLIRRPLPFEDSLAIVDRRILPESEGAI